MTTSDVAPAITTATEALRDRYAAVMMPNYGLPPLALARGEGCVVWDADGNPYLDLLGGIAVSALGHAHPAIVAAVTEQVSRLAHISNLYLHEGQVRLAERLLGLLGAASSARGVMRVILGLAAFGLLIELLQTFSPGRSPPCRPPPAHASSPRPRSRSPTPTGAPADASASTGTSPTAGPPRRRGRSGSSGGSESPLAWPVKAAASMRSSGGTLA